MAGPNADISCLVETRWPQMTGAQYFVDIGSEVREFGVYTATYMYVRVYLWQHLVLHIEARQSNFSTSATVSRDGLILS